MRSVLDAVRSKVSADKNRYVSGDFSLDLTYITDRIIAMSFPAEGVESTYRNNIDDVARVLRENHGDNYMVYNLSERDYDTGKFNNQVHTWCGFPDHHAPPLRLLFQTVWSIHHWLLADPRNVAVVHCLAGKGRTGTVIVAYLLFCGVFKDYRQGLAFFATKRSSNAWGVTGPSQVRALEYFQRILVANWQPRPGPVTLQYIMLSAAPSISSSSVLSNLVGVSSGSTCTPFVHIYLESAVGAERQLVWSSEMTMMTTGKAESYSSGRRMDGGSNVADWHGSSDDPSAGPGLRTYAAGHTIHFHVPDVSLQGDILVEVYHMTGWYRTERIIRCSISTEMLDSNVLHIPLLQLDDAASDKRFSTDFFLDLGFSGVSRQAPDNDDDAVATNAFLRDANAKWWVNEQHGDGTIAFGDPARVAEARKIGAQTSTGSGVMLEKGGWLTKRGHNVKNWKRRWFVLKDPTLCYYNKPRDTTPQGCILLDDILTVLSEQNMYHDANDGSDNFKSVPSDGKYWFEIITRTNSFLIRADTEQDLNDWVESIEFAVAAGSARTKPRSGGSDSSAMKTAPPARHARSGSDPAASVEIPMPAQNTVPLHRPQAVAEAQSYPQAAPAILNNSEETAYRTRRQRVDTMDQLTSAVADIEQSLPALALNSNDELPPL